jgi:hypothetical protein
MIPGLLLLIALLTFSSRVVAHAQVAPALLGPAPSHLLWEKPASLSSEQPNREPTGGFLGPGDLDYRYPGFFVGAGLGLGATAFSLAWCSDPDNACHTGRVLPVGMIMTGVLGLTGAVVGGLFPKAADASSKDLLLSPSVRLDVRRARSTGQGSKGALAGALFLGTIAGIARGGMCERGGSCAGPVIMWGLMGGTVGAVIGGLVAGAAE